MGTPQAAVPSLERLLHDRHEVAAVYTQPDRPSGRGNKITFSPVKEYAFRNNLPVLQPVKIRTPEALDEFRSFKADAALVVAYGRILPDTFLHSFPSGAINLHFSLLPKYRGAAPVNWAIVNGESETGVTTMQMDAGLDTGPIFLQRSTPIVPDETAVDLMERLSFLGANLLSKTLSDLGRIEAKRQDHANASFAPIMKREHGLIDWSLTAKEIANRVRGFQPFPSAFTFNKRAKLTIWKAFPVENTTGTKGIAGSVLDSRGDTLVVTCGGESLLRIEQLQPEGKRRMTTRDFLNGIRIEIGTIFGG